MATERRFRMISIGDEEITSSVYTGKRPAQAALKSFNWYCRRSGQKACEKKFIIKELTKEKDGKEFQYLGVRKQLDTPKEIKRNDKVYTVQYTTTVHKAK